MCFLLKNPGTTTKYARDSITCVARILKKKENDIARARDHFYSSLHRVRLHHEMHSDSLRSTGSHSQYNVVSIASLSRRQTRIHAHTQSLGRNVRDVAEKRTLYGNRDSKPP